jgi:RHS repeat-associated protein
VCNGPAAVNCSGGTAIYGTAGQWKGSQMQSQSETVLNQGVTFGYGDGFNRLTSRTVTSGTLQNYTYAYDRYGNRVSQTPLQGGYTFNPTINPVNNQITTSGYTYDAAGNMLNDGVHSYQYDAEGNLVQVDGGSTAKYVYDVFNQRVHVQTASATTEYIYDYAGRRVSGWLSPNNYGNQGRIYWDGQQIGFRSSDGTNFDHQDILGTERLRTTYSGAVGATYQSLPWGDGYTATVNNSGADQDNLHFAGLERDAESGTEHAQFRNYASAQGRWLVPDSYLGSYDLTNPQSMNRYAYVLNNPTTFIDPSGMCDPDQESDDPCPAPVNPVNPNPPPVGCIAYGTEGCIPAPCGSPNGCDGPAPGTPGTPTASPVIDNKAMQSCLNSFYNSIAGKAVNFFSAGSMIWGPNPFGHFVDNSLEIGSKILAVKAGQAAGTAAVSTLVGQSSIASPLNTLAKWAADLTEAGAETLGLPVLAGATSIDIAAHVACGYAGNSQASQGVVDVTSDPSNTMY